MQKNIRLFNSISKDVPIDVIVEPATNLTKADKLDVICTFLTKLYDNKHVRFGRQAHHRQLVSYILYPLLTIASCDKHFVNTLVRLGITVKLPLFNSELLSKYCQTLDLSNNRFGTLNCSFQTDRKSILGFLTLDSDDIKTICDNTFVGDALEPSKRQLFQDVFMREVDSLIVNGKLDVQNTCTLLTRATLGLNNRWETNEFKLLTTNSSQLGFYRFYNTDDCETFSTRRTTLEDLCESTQTLLFVMLKILHPKISIKNPNTGIFEDSINRFAPGDVFVDLQLLPLSEAFNCILTLVDINPRPGATGGDVSTSKTNPNKPDNIGGTVEAFNNSVDSSLLQKNFTCYRSVIVPTVSLRRVYYNDKLYVLPYYIIESAVGGTQRNKRRLARIGIE